MQLGIHETLFILPGQTNFYRGKVRDVYTINDDKLIMVITDRISAFDVVLPRPIPYKGQVLNLIASQMIKATEDIIPNWLEAVPHPNVAIGKKVTPFKVEMVVRGYLAGHAAREYKAGKRSICGVSMPEAMQENDAFPRPIITPATKAPDGLHDEDISREEIIKRGIVNTIDYEKLERYALALFARGTEMADKQGLILVDTKYEFGKTDEGEIILIDEIHTPDSSRYFYADTYQELQVKGQAQRQLSKEFVREWLMENGFQGQKGQEIPIMTDETLALITNRYIELYEKLTGTSFEKKPELTEVFSIENAIKTYVNNL